jgi:23S rRNA pseudouridine2604 synthase
MTKKLDRPVLTKPAISGSTVPRDAETTSTSGARARALVRRTKEAAREAKKAKYGDRDATGGARGGGGNRNAPSPVDPTRRRPRTTGTPDARDTAATTSTTNEARSPASAKPAYVKPTGPRSAHTRSAPKPASERAPFTPRQTPREQRSMPPVERAPRAPAPTNQGPPDDGSIRLSKLMSNRGICSRREADEWIAKSWVKVDGVIVNELGSRVMPDVEIAVHPAASEEQERRVTILLNKPVGYVSGQAEDGHQPASVLFTEENRWEDDPTTIKFHPMQAKGLAPAGRLDIDSVGLIVFTQDGRVAKQLIGDNSAVEKEYLVRVEGTLSEADLKLLNHGLSLDGEALRPAKVSWQNEDQLRFVLREGKKRQIRRMCELVGLNVVGLKRTRIGMIPLGNLPAGKWRYLGADESFS